MASLTMANSVRAALILLLIGLSGCSRQQQAGAAGNLASAAGPKQPTISLAVLPPVDPTALKPGASLEIVCAVAIETGAFEPAFVIFEISESRDDMKRIVLESFAVREKKITGNSFTFSRATRAPKSAGTYTINAKVFGMDTSLPPNQPEQAPVAKKTVFFNSTRAPQGAHGEFNAPRLTIEVK